MSLKNVVVRQDMPPLQMITKNIQYHLRESQTEITAAVELSHFDLQIGYENISCYDQKHVGVRGMDCCHTHLICFHQTCIYTLSSEFSMEEGGSL